LADDVFKPAEIATLAAFCADMPVAGRWTRRRGPAGEDVIEIEVDGNRPGLLRLKKANGAYAVTGLGGWRLAIFEDLSGMINAVANRLLRPGRPRPMALEHS
jgi:hypothetical protein